MRKSIGIGAAGAMLAATALTGSVAIGGAAAETACTPVANEQGYLGTATAPTKFKLLQYEYVKGVGTLRDGSPEGSPLTYRQLHLAYANESKARCEAVNIGATGSRVNKYDRTKTEAEGALVVFRWSDVADVNAPGVTDAEIEAYALNDPYYKAGLIKKFEIIDIWNVVG